MADQNTDRERRPEERTVRPQRCMYCMESADVAIHDGRGRTTFACEEHMTQAVDGLIKPPQVVNLATHDEIPIKVRWHIEATERVEFNWSVRWGRCYDCGLPAAFRLTGHPAYDDKPDDKVWKRCAVCAANAAVDGESIVRIDGAQDAQIDRSENNNG